MLRSAARMARAAACMRLDDVAAVSAAQPGKLREHLRSLQRGRCAEIAATASTGLAASAHASVVSHRVCPPGARRAHPKSQTPLLCLAGSVAWHSLSPRSSRIAAFRVRALLAGESPDLRQRAIIVAACPPAALERASMDPNPLVRARTLDAAGFVERFAWMLASDPDTTVRVGWSQPQTATRWTRCNGSWTG